MMSKSPHMRLLLLLAGAVSCNPTPLLFARDTCAARGQISCMSQDAAANMCCSAGSSCVLLAGNTTVMCCPSDKSCNKIQPITCNLSEQDPKANPDAPIKTTALDAKLPGCGSSLCCPFGYTCSADGTSCSKDSDQSKRPPVSKPPSTPSPTHQSTPKPTPTATVANSPTPSHSEEPAPAAMGSDKMSIIGGVIGGILALILIVGVIFLCVRSHSKKEFRKTGPSTHDSIRSGPYGNMISGPIAQPDGAGRTDFTRQAPRPMSEGRRSVFQRFSRNSRLPDTRAQNSRQSIPNPFNSPDDPSGESPRMSRSSITSYDEQNARTGQIGARVEPIRDMRTYNRYSSKASTLNVHQDDSHGNVNPYDGGNFAQSHLQVPPVQDSRDTTFSDMMEQADMGDVHKNGGYVPGNQALHVPGTTPRI